MSSQQQRTHPDIDETNPEFLEFFDARDRKFTKLADEQHPGLYQIVMDYIQRDPTAPLPYSVFQEYNQAQLQLIRHAKELAMTAFRQEKQQQHSQAAEKSETEVIKKKDGDDAEKPNFDD
jgi:hypothetical protein